MDCHPVEQTNFPPDYRTVQDMLQDKIESCQAVLHIVGFRYGAEPDPSQLPEGLPRRSYTQMEYDLARQLNKKVYVFTCPDGFPFDECEPEREDKQQLQQAHRDAILNDPRIWTKVTSREQLGAKVRELQLELQQLRLQVRRSTFQVLIGIAALVLVLAGIGYGVSRLFKPIDVVKEQVAGVDQGVKDIQQSVDAVPQKTADEIRKLYEDPDVLTGKLKSHIRQRAEEQIAPLRSDSANWRKIDEIEKQRDQQLERVEQLVETIRDGLKDNSNPIFAEAARILAEQGVDEALEYLQAKQPAIESRVKATKALRDQGHQEFHDALKPWLLEAELHETNLAWEAALQKYEQVAAEAPEWSEARRRLGELLNLLARYSEAEPHLQASLKLARDNEELSLATNSLGLFYFDAAQWKLAEPLMRRALAIDEQSYGPGHPNVATGLNNLASLLQATSRLSEAEPLMQRALAIFATKLAKDHPNTIVVRDNYKQLLTKLEISPDKIERQTEAAMNFMEKLEPIVPEVDRLLGPAKPVADALAELDRQYKTEGKPAIYFLPLSEPITPHLDELLGRLPP